MSDIGISPRELELVRTLPSLKKIENKNLRESLTQKRDISSIFCPKKSVLSDILALHLKKYFSSSITLHLPLSRLLIGNFGLKCRPISI